MKYDSIDEWLAKDEHGRWPTWADAMAHCSDGNKIEALAERGIKVGEGK